jgi:hypothetical protein
VAVAFVKKTAALSAVQKSTPALWQTALYNKYLAGDAVIVFNVSGDKPKPETATTAGRGLQVTKTLAKTHTLNYSDMQGVVQGNVEFYNDILSSSSQYDFYYFTPNRIWDASGNYITVIGDPVITAEINTYQTAEVVVTWVSKTNPLPYEFDTTSFLEGLYIIVANATYPDFVVTTTSGGTAGSTFTADLNVAGLTLGSLLWEVVNFDAGDTGSNSYATFPDPTLGVMEWEFDTNGTATATISVSTENGCVIGQQDVTFVVSAA